jgi:NAD(P)-dependent dehydrogenase (short-subunit alcohol dehydrogenase family)
MARQGLWPQDVSSSSTAMLPIQRLGQPSDVEELALLLASEKGSYITGQTLTVDGGLLLSGL